jgi:hypothetical protein
MDELGERTQRAVESLLENESLTSGLDDVAAQVLLNWGIDCVKTIVASTAELDAASLEDATYPRMRALRRLMRRVNKWAGQRDGLDQSGDAASLKEVIEQAAIVYGPGYAAPEQGQDRSFLMRLAFSSVPAQMIADLRALIENQNYTTGGNNDQINDAQSTIQKDDDAQVNGG